MVDPFGWHKVDRPTLDEIREKLGQFEGRTWGEILNSKHNHNVDIDRLCKDARTRLAALKQNDLEQLLSLRLSGPERIWGILSEGVCTILWWDPSTKSALRFPGRHSMTRGTQIVRSVLTFSCPVCGCVVSKHT
jgi:hypothetical protein